MQSILQEKLSDVTVGGTSAGEALLGNFIFSGANGSALSEVILQVAL